MFILFLLNSLVSCAGSVGNVRLITEDLKGVIGSQDIIRVVTNDSKAPFGFIYSYLASPTAHTYIQSFIYGSVVPRIEPATFSQLPVPKLPQALQLEIHNLIVRSAESRVKGNNILTLLRDEIQQFLEHKLEKFSLRNKKSSIVSILKIKQDEKRFDAPYYTGIGRSLFDAILSQEHVRVSSISEVFLPALFGKKQLKGMPNKGNPLYKSSSMMQIKPDSDFWLSHKKLESYRKLQVKKESVLVSRTGTVGNVLYISDRLNDVFIDDHMVRIIPNRGFSGLIYIYLSSKFGKELIAFQKYGSVQDVINSDFIGRIPIPKSLIQDSFLQRFQESVKKAHDLIDLAFRQEESAIHLIEKEIDQWQN